MSLFASTSSALRYRDFSFYLCARFFGAVAVQMQSVAVGWQVYSLTGEALDLGLIGLAQFLPFVPLVLIAGQMADRFDRRRIITLCYAVEMLCGLLLIGFTITGLKIVWPVFAVMALYGSARAFMMPSSQAIVINLVPAEAFGNAVALSSSSFQLAVILGPALGGLLYLAGPLTVYTTVSALLGLSAVLMLSMRGFPRRTERREPVSWDSILDGLRFVRSRPTVFGAISLDLFAVLFGGATALLPAYASEILHVGPTGLGLLRTAPGAGAALTALLLAFTPISRYVGRWMFGGVAVFGAAVIVLGLSTSFPLSLFALFLLGAGDMVSVYIRHLLVQLETPDAIRGRVSAVNSVFIGASNELGEFESGLTAAWFGLIPAIIVGGAVTLAVAIVWMYAFPELRTMDRFPPPVGETPSFEKGHGSKPRNRAGKGRGS
ncbi:MFS transporter [Methylocaldum szegediense]|uniref:MFS transporter, ENTS family, enterobactin (Siderophore) exporter n=1 Tax=Methylocaldum szegediense TaxID=73780 RepID=A0ABM9I4B9_9GAMM|nr:MFS transporter [Methylocaldum szegediense]CAI8884444.1 MFS transporter, ENTS family, enterobactin (siderophore) exporter [Methylocaldum szegediense]